ncbi:unnamed protein product [Knipowitschia caucasica]
MSLRGVSLKHLGLVFLILLMTSLQAKAKPLRKRTISEVQLMHNVQEHKQVGERQEWLQEKLKDIIVTSVRPQPLPRTKLRTSSVLGT